MSDERTEAEQRADEERQAPEQSPPEGLRHGPYGSIAGRDAQPPARATRTDWRSRSLAVHALRMSAEPVMGDPGPTGRFGDFGGRYIPETLCWRARSSTRRSARRGPTRRSAPSSTACCATTPAARRASTRPSGLSGELGCTLLLKREDLNHTGSHKINNVLGQALLAKRMGKQRVVAETGAGQHGVATATAAALLGLECVVYMGEVDMRAPGAQRVPHAAARRRGASRHARAAAR